MICIRSLVLIFASSNSFTNGAFYGKLRYQGFEAGGGWAAAHRLGRARDAGAALDPLPLRHGAAFARLTHLGLPARPHRDGEFDADFTGRWGGSGADRL